MKKLDIKKKDLIDMYLNMNMSQKKIAEFYGCSSSTIGSYLKEFSIHKDLSQEKLKEIELQIQKANPKAKIIKFINTQKPLIIECSCGKEFSRRYGNIKKTNSCLCVDCSGYKGPASRYTKEQVEEYIEKHGCHLESDFVSVSDPITIKCKCEKVFTTTFFTFKQGSNQACVDCYHKRHAREQAFSNEKVKEVIERNGCTWIGGEYHSQKSKLTIGCAQCGEPYNVSLTKFLYDHQIRCRSCSKSSSGYEIYLKQFLESNKVQFKHDKHLEGAYGIKGGRLRFDFVILKENGEKLVIEIDGQQHYSLGGNKDFFNDKQSFEERKENDRLKEEFCHSNNIPVLRISYKMFRSLKRKEQMERDVLSFIHNNQYLHNKTYHIDSNKQIA